tara:strand:+ start:133 stop:306 length:174 start_codon:yes stop_codon:yes gene_type:complete
MRTAFERLDLGTPVRTDKGLGRIIGISEGRDNKIEIDVRDLDTGGEQFYALEDVEIL